MQARLTPCFINVKSKTFRSSSDLSKSGFELSYVYDSVPEPRTAVLHCANEHSSFQWPCLPWCSWCQHSWLRIPPWPCNSSHLKILFFSLHVPPYRIGIICIWLIASPLWFAFNPIGNHYCCLLLSVGHKLHEEGLAPAIHILFSIVTPTCRTGPGTWWVPNKYLFIEQLIPEGKEFFLSQLH